MLHFSLTARRRRWILAALCLSVLLTVMENTILNVALPSIRRDLGASTAELQWITDAYILVYAGLLMVGGSLGDRFGRKGVLSLGLAIIGSLSIVAMFAQSAAHLIALRAAIGIGAALVTPATLSILVNVFTEPVARGRAIAAWGTTAGIAAAAGPLLGGWLVSHFGWPAVFGVNTAIVALALLAGRILPTSRDPISRPIDTAGSILSVAALVVLVAAIVEAPNGWTRPGVLAGFALAAVLLLALIAVERRAAAPMLDLALFRDPCFTAATLALTLCFAVLNGTVFVATLYLQSVLGLSPLAAGAHFVPGALAMMIAAQVAARLAERFRPERVVLAGLAISSSGLILLAANATPSSGIVISAIAIFYIGVQLVSVPATGLVMSAVPRERAGVGSAVNSLSRLVGVGLGIAIFGSLAGTGAGIARAALVGLAALLAAAVAVARLRR